MKGGLFSFIQRSGKEKKGGSCTPALKAFKIEVAEDAQHVQPCAYAHVPTQPSHLPDDAPSSKVRASRCLCRVFPYREGPYALSTSFWNPHTVLSDSEKGLCG